MKFIVAHSSPFNGTVKIGTVDADSANQAILIAAERDGWSLETMPDSTDIQRFLDSIEDRYIAVPQDQVSSYPEGK